MIPESKRDFIIDIFDNMEEADILKILAEYNLINVRELASKVVYNMSENNATLNTMYDYLLNEY